MRTLLLALLAIAAGAATLYEQSIERMLAARFKDPRLNYLLLDARTGAIASVRWSGNAPVPVGSLVKPFTALAYGEAHGFRFPEYVCQGKDDGCWLPRGHGRLGLTRAIAESCNAYFDRLAEGVDRQEVAAIARRFGLPEPAPTANREALIGMGDSWPIPPLAIARAYCSLVRDPEAVELRRGMALSAARGTGRAAGTGFTKTGTAPCSHAVKGLGDGYAIVLDPAGEPRYALLVRVHGVPGAVAAAVAGRMIRTVEEGR